MASTVASTSEKKPLSTRASLLFGYYNVAPATVKREFLAIADIGPALQKHRVAAALAVGPIGPGEAVSLVASVAKAFKKAPDILAIDEADTIAKQFPQFEAVDIPEGALKGHPEIPSDTAHSLAVTYRFVVPLRMLDVVAGPSRDPY